MGKEVSLGDIMIDPNDNLQYFYEEQETSQRVYDNHHRVNFLW